MHGGLPRYLVPRGLGPCATAFHGSAEHDDVRGRADDGIADHDDHDQERGLRLLLHLASFRANVRTVPGSQCGQGLVRVDRVQVHGGLPRHLVPRGLGPCATALHGSADHDNVRGSRHDDSGRGSTGRAVVGDGHLDHWLLGLLQAKLLLAGQGQPDPAGEGLPAQRRPREPR